MLHKTTVQGILWGWIHFSMETASFFLLFSRISTSPLWWALALLYDALAFLPQSIFGTITDRYPKYRIGLTGAVLMILGLLIPANIPALCMTALGNAMIHVAGANHTLRDSGGKITPNAIFVGFGSFGVITGQLLGKCSGQYRILIPLCLLLFSTVVMISYRRTILRYINRRHWISVRTKVILCLFYVPFSVSRYAHISPTQFRQNGIKP